MNILILLSFFAIAFNGIDGAVTLQNGANPLLLNNLELNNFAPLGLGTLGNGPTFANANCAPNIAGPISPIESGTILAKEVFGSTLLPNTIASAGFLPNTLGNIEAGITNVQFTPLSDLMPSLQYGDITMTGDLPIGGTIKVCGCIPVYGMINVDGAVPSVGKAVVAESYGNQCLS